jgi:TolB-like protein/tetratricopeptide (TPR) repeat protein
VLKLASVRPLLLLVLSAPCFSLAGAQAANVSEPGGRVILVLPFENRSGQPALNWIGDSFPDTLNQRLNSAAFLTISRDDRRYALDHLGLPVDFRPTRATTLRIAQTLDADYVIVGSFNVQQSRIVVQAQVLEVNQLRLTPPLEDSAELARLFDVENAIAWKVARQIEPKFSVAEQTFLSASAGIKLTAFESYIRGTDAPTPAERVKRLEAAVSESPGYTAAELSLGKELYADRQFNSAATELARVPKDDRLALEANFYIGLARFNEAKYQEAEQAFAFVASRLPLPEVVNDQAVAQARQGRDATALFQRASIADPNDPDYHYNLAVSHFRHGDYAGAQREVDETLKLRPADTEAAELRTLVAGHSAATATGNGFDPTERLRRAYSEASFRQAAFQLDQIRAMRLATLPPPQQATEYAQLGHDYLAQGLLPEAEEEFQAAIAAYPSGPQGHAGLAQIRERSGYADQAREEAQTSLRLQPNVEAYLVLARVELQANHLQLSATYVHNALQIEPKNSAAMGMRQALAARGQQVQ